MQTAHMHNQALSPPSPFDPSHFHARQPSTASSAYGTGGLQDSPGAYSDMSVGREDDMMREYYTSFDYYLQTSLDEAQRENIRKQDNKARGKLLKLPQGQFSELATDVFDEMQRRMTDPQARERCLLPLDSLHPKRNVGREKLSILPPQRFYDLCTDIMVSIEVRHPHGLQRYQPPPMNEPGYNEERVDSQSTTKSQDSNPSTTAMTTPQMDHYDHHQDTHQNRLDQPPEEFTFDQSNASANTTKQPLQTTTIIPKKGMLVEEDDDDDDGDDDDDEGDDEEHGLEQEPQEQEQEQDEELEETHRDMNDTDETLNATELKRGSTLDSIAEEDAHSEERVQHSRIYSNRQSRYSQDFTTEQLKRAASGPITPPDSAKPTESESAGYFNDHDEHVESDRQYEMNQYDKSENTANFSRQLKDRDEQIQMLVKEGSRMDETINTLEKQLADSEEMKNSLVDETRRLHELVTELEQVRENHLAKISKLEKEGGEKDDTHSREIGKYQDQLREVEQKLADAETRHLTMQDKHAALLNHQNESNDETSRLNQTINDLQANIAEHETTIASLRNTTESNSTPRSVSAQGGDLDRDELQKKYDKLKKDYSKLNKELEQQQEITDKVRQEASEFLEEMRALASNQSTWENSQSLQSEVNDLKVEVQEWKSRYLRAKSQARNARSSMYNSGTGNRNVFQPQTSAFEKDSPYYDKENGMVRDTSVHKFQIAMEDFLVKSRTDAGNLMDHLHHLIVAARGTTQDITEGKTNNDAALQSELAQCTSMVSTTANNLITTTRNFTTSGGLTPIAVLDAAASDLSSAVIELIKHAKIRSQSDDDPDAVFPPRPDSGQYENGDGYDDTYTYDGHTAVEEQPSTTESMYDTSPTSNSKHHQDPVNPSERSIYPNDERPNSKHNNRQSSGLRNEFMSPGAASDSLDDNRITVKNAEARRKRYASQHDSTILVTGQRFDVDDPDNTVAELQAYLEQKTLGVIEAIQSLLTGIRNNSTMGELRPYLESIVEAVNKMVEATGKSMQQTRNKQLKDKGSYILANLEDCSQRMTNVKTHTDELADPDYLNKNLKQRLAGISFDMTKCTKELVKTVEEVSLNDEIRDIDEQLGT